MLAPFSLGVLLLSAVEPTLAAYDRPSLIINNYCEFDVYLWTQVTGGHHDDHPHEVRAGAQWSRPVYYSGNGNPVVKIAVNPYLVNPHGDPERIFQVEYGYGPDRIHYDLSDIDCKPKELCPFRKHRHTLLTGPDDCVDVHCSEEETFCKGAYQYPTDNLKMHTCLEPSSDLTVNLCLEAWNEVGSYPPQSAQCEKWHYVANDQESCANIQRTYGITFQEFYRLNPQIGDDCQWLTIGKSFCVQGVKCIGKDFIA